MAFFFSNFFYDLRRISVGVFSKLKIPKSEDYLLKPGKLGPLYGWVGLIFLLKCTGPDTKGFASICL
jgi:hypothetical protein